MRQKVVLKDLGLIPYAEAWDLQTRIHQELIARKTAFRKEGFSGIPPSPPLHYLLFCEHPPVYTLGKSGSIDHLLLNEQELEREGIEFFKINRGGDITYHGPGQIVAYPIFDMEYFFTDVHRYVRYLEEAVMLTLADYGLDSIRVQGYTGVWMPASNGRPDRKICAIGVHMSRWVTLHGLAFNIQPQLEHFGNIIPCGIQEEDKSVTSLALESGSTIDMQEVKSRLSRHFADLFGFDFVIENSTHEKGYSPA